MKYIKFWASVEFKLYTFLSRNPLGSGLYRIGAVFHSLCILLKQRKYTKKCGKYLGMDLKIYEFPTMMSSGSAHRAARMYVHRPRPWYIADATHRSDHQRLLIGGVMRPMLNCPFCSVDCD